MGPDWSFLRANLNRPSGWLKATERANRMLGKFAHPIRTDSSLSFDGAGVWPPVDASEPRTLLPELCSSRIKTGSSVACDKAGSTRAPVCRHGGGVPSGAVAHSYIQIQTSTAMRTLLSRAQTIQFRCLGWLLRQLASPNSSRTTILNCTCLHRYLSDLIIDPRHQARSEDVSAPPSRNWLTFGLRPGTWKEMRRFHYEMPLRLPNCNTAIRLSLDCATFGIWSLSCSTRLTLVSI